MGDLNSPKGVGGLVISEEVIAKIAASAAISVPGVADVMPKPSDIRNLIIKDRNSRSVRIDHFRNTLVLDVYISVEDGTNVTDLALKVQQKVKDSVQSMAGRPVSKVNVYIVDVNFAADEAE